MRVYGRQRTGLRSMLLLAAIVGGLSNSSRAEGFIDDLAILPNGAMTLPDGIEMGVEHYDDRWALSRQVLGSVTLLSDTAVNDGTRWSMKGKFVGGDFHQTIARQAPNRAQYHVSFDHPQGIATNDLVFTITLPATRFGGQTLSCNGQAIHLPKPFTREAVYSTAAAKSLVISTAAGRFVVRSSSPLFIQDARAYAKFGSYEWFALRFAFSSRSGKVTKSEIDLTLELQPWKTEPVSIAAAANMGFADEVAGDNVGGWTDQGPSNDLRTFPIGQKRFGGVNFDIADPGSTGGKSCMVFVGPERSAFLKSATVPMDGRSAAYLYLLHAIAWPKDQYVDVGDVRVNYADGAKESFTVRFGRDVSNWWNALSVENGDVVWTDPVRGVGLFLSRFKLKTSPITSLEFVPTAQAVWMVAGMSMGESVPKPMVEPPTVIVAGNQWTPYAYDLSVKRDSIMDFSSLHPAPAGRFGHVVIRDGHFAFADEKAGRARFIGGNLCFSANYQSKDACKKLAENMARMGYNAARLHHYDTGLANFSGVDVVLNNEELDKLDYLIACFKEQGIYVTFDLHTLRIPATELIPGGSVPSNAEHVLKVLIPFHEPARKTWESFTRNLLTHVNPYTKLALKDEPAIFAISILNENNIDFWIEQFACVRPLVEEQFAAWLTKTNQADVAKKSSNDRATLYTRFLAETQLRSYERCRDFIRSLGCNALLTDVNFGDDGLTRFVRPHLDFSDNHVYRAMLGPIHRYGALPAKSNQDNDLTTGAMLAMNIANTRVFGKPFTVTEFNLAFPNRYRCASGLIMGGYGALQDWDGLFRFAYAHVDGNTQNVGAAVWAEAAQDPIVLLSERISALLFVRGDVLPAKQAVPIVTTADDSLTTSIDDDKLKQTYKRLGLRYRIGQWDVSTSPHAPKETRLALGVTKAPPTNDIAYQPLTLTQVQSLLAGIHTASLHINSDTDQMRLQDVAGELSIVTDRTECFAMAEKTSHSGKLIAVKNDGPFSVVAVSAMDGQSLAKSQRFVIFHLTDSSNTNARFVDRDCTIIEEWGQLPQLVRRGSATVTMKCDTKCPRTLYAVTMSGERKNEVAIKPTKDGIEFTLNTDQPTGGCMTYELVVE